MPDYYKSKLNVAILLAPPAAMSNVTNSFMQAISYPAVRASVLAVVNLTHLWNTMPVNKF